MKTVGLDASRANRALRTGVERYSFEIIREILRQGPEDWRFRLYLDAPPRKDVADMATGLGSRAVVQRLSWPPRVLWTQTRLAWETLVRKPDLLFVSGHVLPVLHSRPAATVIHDVAFLTHPQAFTKKGGAYLRFTTWLAARTADRIIVPTQAVRDDLLKRYPRARGLAERVRVVPHGVSVPAPLTEGECAMVRAKLGVRQPYALMLGRVERKKNVGRALAALAEIRKSHPDLDVVLIGSPWRWYAEEMGERKGAAWVRELGAVPDRETFALLQGASVLLFPSLAEGFGLPILEAFSYGIPVVTSKGGATEEVSGGLAHLVDPLSVESIADGIRRALADKDPSAAERRRVHAARFTWAAAGERTIGVLRELL